MFPRRRSIKLVDVAGIRIGVDPTWFVALFLLIFLLSGSFRNTLDSSSTVAYVTTVATVLLFFGSLIVHELGHAVAARRHGIQVTGIDLFLFGGLTRMSREPATAGEEFEIAVAGPAGTLLFALVCLVVGVAAVGWHQLWDAVVLATAVHVTPVLLALAWLIPMNLLILVFNLVPAYPLDGGRIARAIVWRTTGDRERGTRAAAKSGQWFAILLAGIGIWLLLRGSLIGAWLLMLSFLTWQSAKGSLLQSAVATRINTVRVGDVMDRDPLTLPSITPLADALDQFFLRYAAVWLPVTDESGRFLGISQRERVQAANDDGNGWLTVASMLDGDVASVEVNEDRPLTEVLGSEAMGRLGAVVAVDRDGMLRGVITADQIRRALQAAFATPI
jgi:Zn-dependent protease/CBS domain-containing protein